MLAHARPAAAHEKYFSVNREHRVGIAETGIDFARKSGDFELAGLVDELIVVEAHN